MKTVLRRTASDSKEKNRVVYEGIELDLDIKRCTVDGKEVKLVKKEFEILHCLLSNPSRVLSREEIMQQVWKGEVVVNDRTVDVNITRIRSKIAPYSDHIITRSGYGYGFI